MEYNSPPADQDVCNDFSTKEVVATFKILKAGKAASSDNLHSEVFLYFDKKCF